MVFITVQEINSKERDQFWLKEEQEEKKRIEAERKRREEVSLNCYITLGLQQQYISSLYRCTVFDYCFDIGFLKIK